MTDLIRRLFWFLLATTTGLILYAQYLIFLVVPNEVVMGPVQRIFYFHVGAAIACYTACALMLGASMWVLATKSKVADAVNQSAAEAGLCFSLIVMATGMIWGHSAWNTWFRFEPRLVTFLLLTLIFLGLGALRIFGERARIADHAAILGLLSAVTVPLVIYSIKLLPTAAQLHPQVVENRGLRDPSFEYTMIISMAALTGLCLLFVVTRMRILFLERRAATRNRNQGPL